MTTQSYQTQTESYKSIDLKLSALILSEIPDSTVEVYQEANSSKKMIEITYIKHCQGDVDKLVNDFINRRARVDLFRLNKSLNIIRNKIKIS